MDIPLQRIELTYLLSKQMPEVIVKDFKPITYGKRRHGKESSRLAYAKKRGTHSAAKKNITPLSLAGKNQTRFIKSGFPEAKENRKAEKAEDKSGTLKDGAVRENYYLRVREKIRSTLEQNSRDFIRGGDISVKLTIGRDGMLKYLAIDKSSKDIRRFLKDLAIKSIKQASPFPPFSEEIKTDELRLTLPIRFSRN